jgi:ABC-type multidrug transport system fused ATPase/permease subunit
MIGGTGRATTTIVVAHRLSTAKNADIIFFIENGQVAESGKHQELITRENGKYRKLVQNQLH